VLSLSAERFERRLTQEIGGSRAEIHSGFTGLRQDLSNQRAELLKWSFLFWIGQIASIAGLLAFVRRVH